MEPPGRGQVCVYRAKHLLTVAHPPVRNGAVAVRDGRIIAAGLHSDVLKAAGTVREERDLGDAVLLPGVINAHTHIELSWLASESSPQGDYVDWIRGLLQRRAKTDMELARSAADAAVAAAEASGTVAFGDITNEGWAPGVWARAGLAGIGFLELYGFRAQDADEILERAARRLDELDAEHDATGGASKARVVLTPHAPHTCSRALLRGLAGRADAAREPLSIHVAESEAEVALLAAGSGPMAELLKERGVWDSAFSAPGLSPVEYLDRLGLLTPRTLAVHCVHLDHQDLSKLQARRVTVVTCPRSNARLGVGKAPVPRLLSAGIPVALGTDSLASAPDLNLFAEMAALRSLHPGLAPAAVLRIATLNGAAALQLASDLGSIEPGKLARIIAVPLGDPADDPLETVTSGPATLVPLPDGPT